VEDVYSATVPKTSFFITIDLPRIFHPVLSAPSASYVKLNKALHDDLCGLMSNLSVKVKENGAASDYVFQDTFSASDELNATTIRTMVENWIDIEDSPEILDCEIDAEIEKIMRHEPDTDGDDDDDDDDDEINRAAQVQAPKLSHQDAEALVQQLVSHVLQHNLSTEHVQGLQKLAKDLNRAKMEQPRIQSTLTNYFGPKLLQPPK
jgi:uncharacterized protein (DUF2267 family)